MTPLVGQESTAIALALAMPCLGLLLALAIVAIVVVVRRRKPQRADYQPLDDDAGFEDTAGDKPGGWNEDS